MRGLFVTLFFLTYAAAAAQQLSIVDPSVAHYNKCLNEALQDNAARKLGAQTSYSCYGETARVWYDSLSGDKQVRDKNGLFIARYYGASGYCAHQIEDETGKPLSDYVCEIVTDAPK